MNSKGEVSGVTHCYDLTYVDRDGWQRKKTYHAKSHDEALAKAAKDGIEDIIGVTRSDNCLLCRLSRHFHNKAE